MLPSIQQISLIRVLSDVKGSFSWTEVQKYEAFTGSQMTWEGTLQKTPLKNRKYPPILAFYCNAPCVGVCVCTFQEKAQKISYLKRLIPSQSNVLRSTLI